MTTTAAPFAATRIDISTAAATAAFERALAASRKIKRGAQFRILLGTPRTGSITKVTATKVYFTTVNPAGETIPQITSRDIFDNTAMIEVL